MIFCIEVLQQYLSYGYGRQDGRPLLKSGVK